MDRRVTELISAAERNIEERQFDAAIKQLEAAEQIEPDNKSVELIRSLIDSLQGTPRLRKQNLATATATGGTGNRKPTAERAIKTKKQIKSSQISSLFDRLRQGKFFP